MCPGRLRTLFRYPVHPLHILRAILDLFNYRRHFIDRCNSSLAFGQQMAPAFSSRCVYKSEFHRVAMYRRKFQQQQAADFKQSENLNSIGKYRRINCHRDDIAIYVSPARYAREEELRCRATLTRAIVVFIIIDAIFYALCFFLRTSARAISWKFVSSRGRCET